MALEQGVYICIDLKSFYASVECVARGLDPLKARLVVADESRTDKTICLAVSPALKALGVPGRPRLFEVKQKLQAVQSATGRKIDFITAVPRMAKYIECSCAVYAVYLRYIAPEDIHVYSIDEVFIDASRYLKVYHLTAHALAQKLIREVLARTGVTATAGIGTNLYLAKIAMDIVAKRMEADADGVRIAELDEAGYRRLLWDHRPITDFWRIGHGSRDRLARLGVFTMGDLARLSLSNEDILYREFGVDAELLIDHAWGQEPCGMWEIKHFQTSSKSLSSGQVLPKPYPFEKARLIVREMTEALVLELVEKGLMAEALVLHLGYDREAVDKGIYKGETRLDAYGRRTPRSAHGTASLGGPSSSSGEITAAVLALFNDIADPRLTVRRVTITAIRVLEETAVAPQFDLFTDLERKEKERNMQRAVLSLQKKYGKNAVLKGSSLLEDATMRQRNCQIGGHRA